MGMSVRAVVACAIPTAVAVIGFIFFWTRKKPEPDKRSTMDPKKSHVQKVESVLSKQDKVDSLQDVAMTSSGMDLNHVEEPIILASKAVDIETVPFVEEEILCAEAQSNEFSIAPSYVNDIQSAPMTATNLSALHCYQDSSEDKPEVVSEHETCAPVSAMEAESSDGHCECPTSLNGAEPGSSPQEKGSKTAGVLSDRKRVDSGLEDVHNYVDKVDSSLVKPAPERPDSIPLSPRRPMPADSPNEHLNNSDSVSEASEVSNDSGKGASVAENHLINLQMNGETHITYQFAFPSELCGRMVGKHGRNINEIKDRSGAQITLLRQPFTKDAQVCCLEGTETEIQLALEIIKKRFPSDRFPKINYDQIDTQHPPAQSPVLSPDLMQLKLPAGVSSDAIVSSMVDVSHVFLQQPTHPSFPSLERLNQYMNTCYTQDLTVPPLPKPVEGGVICAAPIMDGWYRAQVMTVTEDESECDIKFLDYGGYSRVTIADLRQIRSDFMTLPFQATECYMANIAPLADEEVFSIESAAILEELTQGHLLQVEIVTYDEESGIPFVNMYRMDRDSVAFINRELVNRGVVRWLEAA
ncbi:A-kinase anchor protein 1, mitochondrial-like isoform X2 [Lineus longissimus]|uniref:A-kinase anchor protein 1, mitochondrial-like isoform X2 n=1 Tax=Lineus longissimus TaxID=88925 RepID=UPI002B4D0E41